MSTTANDILALARSQIGVKEVPAGSNNVKYNTAYYGSEVHGADYAWCCAFVWWLFQQAGASALFYGGGTGIGRKRYCDGQLKGGLKWSLTGQTQILIKS